MVSGWGKVDVAAKGLSIIATLALALAIGHWFSVPWWIGLLIAPWILLPIVIVAVIVVGRRERKRKRTEQLSQMKSMFRKKCVENPWISHTALLRNVRGNHDMKESAIRELVGLGELEIQRRGRIRRYFGKLEPLKMDISQMVSEDPGTNHTRLLRSTEGERVCKESAIRQLLDEGNLRCERRGRDRVYFLQ